MSEEAEKPDEDEKPEVEEGAEPQEGDKPDEAEDETEIVLAGEEGSQPENKNLGIRRRINKLNAKVAKAEESQTAASTALEVEKERNRLLQLALDQRTEETPEAPDPNDYDDGVADPQYVAAFQAHITKNVQEEIKKSQPQQRSAPSQDLDLEAKQVKHYERADALKVRDYDDTEAKAVDVLGKDIVQQIQANTEKSEQVLYFLGKNPGRAEDIRELIDENPVKGILEIGTLAAGLTVKPKANREPAPDPDTELEGGTSPKPNLSDYERKLDKLRAKASETGDIGPVLAFKKEHAARAN